MKNRNCPLLMGMSVWIEAGGTDAKSQEGAIHRGEERLEWLESAYEVFYPHTAGGYIGDDDLEENSKGRNMYESYFGSQFTRLQQIKQRVDPKNIFHSPLSIPLP